MLSGKKAMLSVTTGGTETMYTREGPNGIDIEHLLYPISHGTLYFCGIELLPPFAAYAVSTVDDATRQQYMDDYKQRLEDLKKTSPMKEHVLTY